MELNKTMNREALSLYISKRLKEENDNLKAQFNNSKDKIGYFFIDQLLPEELTLEINKSFPEASEMVNKKSIRENKHVAAQMNKYHPLLEEAVYAFQSKEVISEIEKICSLNNLFADEHLYAGGISSMQKNQFLNPHLDNSHDKNRERWRVLNLLFYVTPNWEEKNGGNLELWPNGLQEEQITIHSKFNRLVVMATHQKSWHSVSPVTTNASRNCVSNYYFSNQSLKENDTFHVTTFRARPGDYIKNKLLILDSFLRMNIRKIFKKGVVENPHVYKKEE